jgi:hypothetical protein
VSYNNHIPLPMTLRLSIAVVSVYISVTSHTYWFLRPINRPIIFITNSASSFKRQSVTATVYIFTHLLADIFQCIMVHYSAENMGNSFFLKLNSWQEYYSQCFKSLLSNVLAGSNSYQQDRRFLDTLITYAQVHFTYAS